MDQCRSTLRPCLLQYWSDLLTSLALLPTTLSRTLSPCLANLTHSPIFSRPLPPPPSLHLPLPQIRTLCIGVVRFVETTRVTSTFWRCLWPLHLRGGNSFVLHVPHSICSYLVFSSLSAFNSRQKWRWSERLYKSKWNNAVLWTNRHYQSCSGPSSHPS